MIAILQQEAVEMIGFDYDHTSPDVEYYEILSTLMERWEYEIVEFKEAKGQYSEDKIGQYFSLSVMRQTLRISNMVGLFLASVNRRRNSLWGQLSRKVLRFY